MASGVRAAICVFALAGASGSARAPALSRARTALRPVHIVASSAGGIGAAPAVGDSQPTRLRPFLPCGDALDKKILALALPATINLAIFPLAGAVDVYWVGRMGEARVLAGMGAANQVFSTLFWLIAFLPSVTTPRVAEAIGKGDRELAAARVCEALALACALGLFGLLLVQLFPATLLSVVTPPSSAIFESALPYLRWRSVSFVPALFSAVAFSAFRAEMDAVTPLLITLFSNVLNCVLDPILIFNLNMGVAGAGLATAVSECASCALFAALLVRKGVVRPGLLWRAVNRRTASELFAAGGAVQLRSLSIQAAFLYVARTVSRMDSTGVSAAAHQITLQFWQLGGIALLAVSTAASVIIPALRARPEAEGGGEAAAACAADRILVWGAAMGGALGLCLLGLLPFASRLSPLEEVRRAARPLALFAALLQPLVGLVFAGEGVMQGLGCFGAIAKLTALGSISMVLALKLLAPLGLSGVWLSFFVFNVVRLAAVLRHHHSTGPLARVSRCAAAAPPDAAAAPPALK